MDEDDKVVNVSADPLQCSWINIPGGRSHCCMSSDYPLGEFYFHLIIITDVYHQHLLF